ncbi:hypothetical protein SUGI_1007110 [Cryptomeria japonica]|nr:hypothetical protein SUGI_1007110 [Cryptomeria japonica]
MLDILKLENQIPLCVLEMIPELELEDSTSVRDWLAKRLTDWKYFKGYRFSSRSEENDIAKHIENGPLHLLDLSRRVIADFLSSNSVKCCACYVRCCNSNCIVPPNGVDCSLLPRTNKIPSADKLQNAGIELQLSTQGKIEFKSRHFRHSRLLLPKITVDKLTQEYSSET